MICLLPSHCEGVDQNTITYCVASCAEHAGPCSCHCSRHCLLAQHELTAPMYAVLACDDTESERSRGRKRESERERERENKKERKTVKEGETKKTSLKDGLY